MTVFPSVRARLTAWNVGIVALVLVASGAAVRYLLQASLIAAVDRELDGQGRFWAAGFGMPRPPAFGGPWRFRAFGRRREPFRPPGRPAATAQSGSQRLGPRVLDRDGNEWATGQPLTPWDAAAFDRSLRGAEVHDTIFAGGEELRLYSLPGRRFGAVQGVVQVVQPLAATRRALDQLTQILLVLVPGALLLAGLGGAFLTGRALQPVREITRATSAIQAENLAARLPVRGRDEFARLTAVLNGMLERLETAFERQKRFTGDASHELRTPLATIKATASLAREDAWGAEACQGALATIESAVDRASRIVDDLLLLARVDSRRLAIAGGAVPVQSLLERAVLEATTTAPASSPGPPVRIELPAAATLQVLGDADQLTRLLVNLLENARRHTPASGSIRLAAGAEDGLVVISVTDTGEGIAPEHLPHLGERFYRLDAARTRARGGAGLGLAICKSIAEAHGGAIRIDSVRGEGTTVTILLPRARGLAGRVK
jgi:signal transduction histidine kinase